MTRLPLVIHERLGTWARQLRPRVVGLPLRPIETRSADDLPAAIARSACPLAVIDLADRPRAGLEDLDRLIRLAPAAMALVLDPKAHAGVAPLARELGATHVISGPVPPPDVVALLVRWLPIARRRAADDGWADDDRDDDDPWGDLLPDDE